LIGRFEHLLSTAQRISFCPAGPVQKRSATAEAGPRVKRVELNRSACACRTQTGGLRVMGIVSEP
jgi:hypothetical protein